MNTKSQTLAKRRTVVRVTILSGLIFCVAGLPAWSSFARRLMNGANSQQSNSAPVANPDSLSVTEDTGLAFSSRLLSQNDGDTNTDSLTVTALNPTADTHGSVFFSTVPAYTYRALVPVGQSTDRAVSKDLNGDGKSDLVVTDSANNQVSILLATETGAFASPTNIPVGQNPGALAVQDLNSDGQLDLAVANRTSRSISIVLGSSGGSFGSATHFSVTAPPSAIGIGDFNRDGIADLAMPIEGFSRVTVLLGTGGGSFGAGADLPTGSSPISVAVADFDQDGSQDLALGNASGDNLSILRGDGAGSFGPPQPLTTGGGRHSVITSDFNADNIPDLAVGNGGNNTVSILLGTGGGAFNLTNLPSGGVQPSDISIADINQDGKTDLLVSHFHTYTSAMMGTGTGSFSMAGDAAPVRVPEPQGLAIGDFTGDGTPDLAITGGDRGETGGKVTIMLGTGGTVSSATAEMFLNAGTLSFLTAIAAADLNHDGNRDLAVASFDLGVFTLIGNGTGSFTRSNPIPAGSGARSIAVSDFNNDSHPDLVVANDGSDNVSILLGTGTGSFQPAMNFPAGTDPFDVTVGEFNGDGAKDLAVANSSVGSISILMGTGTGSFGAPSTISVGGMPRCIAVADLDADGNQDLAVASGSVWVLRGTGTGTFATPNRIADSGALYVATEDLNDDGVADLIAANGVSETVTVFLGSGGGTFGAPANFAVGRQAHFLGTGDLNGDGHADLAVGGTVLLGDGTGSLALAGSYLSHGAAVDVVVDELSGDDRLDLAIANSNGTVALLRGTGDGSVQGAISIRATNPQCVKASDLNLDGVTDLIVCSGSTSASVTVFLGRGNGTFSPGAQVTTGFGTVATVATGDLNRDGKPDLVTLSPDTDRVAVLLGTGTGSFGLPTELVIGNFPIALAIGDLNQDGNPDVAVANGLANDVSILLGTGNGGLTPVSSIPAGLGPNSIALSDLNTDGKVDMVVVNRTGNDVHVRMGIGGGSFAAASVYQTGGRPTTVAVADYNTDGVLDLVVGKDDGTNNSCIFIGAGAGAFQPAANFWVGGWAGQLASADFDGDGKPDLVTNSHVVLGNGSGLFGAGTQLNDFGDSMTVGDFNQDGRPDTVLANYTGNRLTVLLNATTKNITYAPEPNFNGTATFEYTVRNRSGATNVGTVTITVNPVNDVPVARARNVTVSAGAQCRATASVDNGSSDLESGQVTLTQTPAGPYQLGATTVTLTATDSDGASSVSQAIVTVTDDVPPILTVPGDLTVSTTSDASSCGVPIEWLGSYFANDNCSGIATVTVTGVPPGNLFPVGTTTVTYSATDARGNTSTGTQRVTVIDATAPAIGVVSVDKPNIWPAKNQMVEVTLDYKSTDNCDPAVTCTLAVSSNEPGGGGGDWEIIDAQHIRLRAEKGEGRTPRSYTITVTCVDSNGNSSRKSVTVTVTNR